MISRQSQAYIFSSDPLNKPSYISDDGTLFDVQLDAPITLPRHSFDCTLEVTQATVWNTVSNISAVLLNNAIDVFYSGTLYSIVIRDGLYSVENLNAIISRDLVNLGLPPDVITVTGDTSTQLINLTFSTVASYVDFTSAVNCRVLLGFDQAVYPVGGTTVVNETVIAPKVAEFNTIESFLIKSTLVNGSIPTNQSRDQTICSIPIPARSVGSQITYEALRPIQIDAESLKQSRQQFTNRLTDQTGKPAPTGETWSFTCVIRYSVPV